MPLSSRARTRTPAHRILVSAVAVALLLPVLAVVAPTRALAATALSADERRAHDSLTRTRAGAGLRPLAACSDLVEVARAWSVKMAAGDRLSHNPYARDQIRGWWAWGENVGVGSSVDVVHGALEKSPGHRANMLSTSFLHTGIGVAQGHGRTWITQVFRRPKSGQSCVAPALPAPPLPSNVTRLAGRDRHGTAVALSRASFATATTVLIASAERFPDALAAAPLSATLGAPVLLSDSSRLGSATAGEIRRLGATRAVVLGSTGTLSSAVDKELRGLGLAVERVGGADRYETAALIARRVGGRTAVLAKGVGEGWVDAVAATGYAAHRRLPVLLTDGESITAQTASALSRLDVSNVIIVGGTSAVSTRAERNLTDRGIKVSRLAGADRLATSAKVADASITAGLSPDRTYISTSRNWADALSAGPAATRRKSVLLLADPRRVSTREATGQWLDRQGSAVRSITLVGGTAALADRVGHDAAAILKN